MTTHSSPAPLTEAEQAAAEVLSHSHNWRAEIGSGLEADDFADEARAVVAAVRPQIVAEILADHESEHIVQFEETTFSVQHPLSERLDGSLFDCQVHEELSSLGRPPVSPGRYRAVSSGPYSRYRFEPIGENR